MIIVRFDMKKSYEKSPSSFSKPTQKPKGILKLNKIESCEVREADER